VETSQTGLSTWESMYFIWGIMVKTATNQNGYRSKVNV